MSKSALVKGLGLVLALLGLLIVKLALDLPQPVAAQGPAGPEAQVVTIAGPFSMDKDLRSLPEAPAREQTYRPLLHRFPTQTTAAGSDAGSNNPLGAPGSLAPKANMPGPIMTTLGITATGGGCSCAPPDPNGDIGSTYYIQAVNTAFRIYNKADDTPATGVITFNSLWTGALTGTPCDLNHDGDPVVLYDHMADRWLLDDFVVAAPPFYNCIAISKTSNPVSGGWWFYAVGSNPPTNLNFPDYPKFGLWPDAYYMTTNDFNAAGTALVGVSVWAFDRTGMLAGTGAPGITARPEVSPTHAVHFFIDAANLGATYSLLAAKFRFGPPPLGRDEWLASIDSPANGSTVINKIHLWKLHYNVATPAASTLTAQPDVTVGSFTDAFQGGGTMSLVPQPSTTTKLDTLGDRLMANLWYQNIGGAESLWATHTVSTTGPTGVMWHQLNVTGGTAAATPIQEAILDPGDGLYRFMPSLALDDNGNMAVGYSASNAANFPSIRWAGRLRTDPLNTLAQGEATVFAGTGSQSFTCGTGPCSRWGDYSAMSVDPINGCNFWYTNEYYASTGTTNWQTRIANFAFTGCNAPTAVSLTGFDVQANNRGQLSLGLALGAIALGFGVITVYLRKRK